ncbi:site-2 protease family protein [Actinoplanes awajinensis]|uniref:Zinc metalloprotease n=1 Tax=Actinoplanes awajinensis subsp. mycoplanecinus TaxID=135947 RepID=A0A101JB08_9ACTN|nr:site-2 protease family protein [Actinoplanes awajinensis]KUL23463.1 hypothetical protein ADL15_45620 [Actinoplanes awajinensis subsp. mycoplanecinus]
MGAHWSVLLILFLLVYSLAVGMLPAVAGGYPPAGYWLTALLIAGLFLTGLVGHELAHAVMAQHYRIPVTSITLWALGGISELDGKPHRPRAELLIALAGPAASLLVAGTFAAATAPAGLAGADLLRIGLSWLAEANLLLAGFNLLPGAPLDGGRALTAILWGLRGDRSAAQRVAAQTGGLLGLLLAGAGVMALVAYAATGGLWLILLGWYLTVAARGEETAAALSDQLRGILVGEVMSTPAVCGYAGHTVPQFVTGTARWCPHRAYPVTDIDGRLAGLVTVATLAAVPPERRASTRLADVMIPRSRLRVTHVDEALLDIVPALDTPARTVVVVDQDRPSGVVTAGDVSRLAGVARLGAHPAGRAAR